MGHTIQTVQDKGCDATDGDGGRAHAAGQGGGERAAKTQPGQQQQQKEEEEDEEDGGHNQQQQAPAKRRRLLFWRRGPPPAAAPAAEAPGAPERAADDALRRGGPLDLLRRGGAAGDPSVTRVPPPEQLPNPLLLTREAVRALLRITEEELADVAPAPVPEAARKLHPLLPDLYLGDGPGSDSGGGGDGQGGGLHLTHGAAAAAVCNLMATVFNRLVANSLCDASWAAGAPPPRFAASQSFREPAAASSVDEAVAGPQSGGASSEAGGGSGRFGVCLQEGGPVYYSQEELVDALGAPRAARVAPHAARRTAGSSPGNACHRMQPPGRALSNASPFPHLHFRPPPPTPQPRRATLSTLSWCPASPALAWASAYTRRTAAGSTSPWRSP